ncbi:MAG: acetolactate synthase small subunit [Myxococcota bacterium]
MGREDIESPDSASQATDALATEDTEAPATKKAAVETDHSIHVFSCLAQDLPGVLARITGLFSRRNYNIISLTAGRTETPGISRLTIVIDASKTSAREVEANLYKLVNVLQVSDVTQEETVIRNLVLVKIRADVKTRPDVLQICQVFRARVVDAAPGSIIAELTGSEAKLRGFLDVVEPFGVIEIARTGRVAMVRGATPLAADPDKLLRPTA